jgi:hypothetical protein
VNGLQAQLQAFAAAVLAPQPAAIDQLRKGPAGGAARLDVYHHAYRARLLAALHDNYETLARTMGDEAFEALGLAYAAAHPSQQPSIRWFGHQLAEFMQSCLAADNGLVPHAALADLARMEWALRCAFDAADGPVLTRSDLAPLSAAQWPSLCFRLHVTAERLGLQWAVEPAWAALQAQALGDEQALPAPEPHVHWLLVWRRGLQTQWRSLPGHEAALLQGLVQGETFAQLCERAVAWVDDAQQAAPLVVGCLQQWLDEGLLGDVTC